MYYLLQLILSFVCLSSLQASQYPVDVSFMIADFKYSREQGVKICEVQHGILSTFRADRFLNGENPVIANAFVEQMSQLYDKSWALHYGIAEIDIRSRLDEHPSWELKRQFRDILKDVEFNQKAKQKASDPYDLASYHGFVFVRANDIKDIEAFRQKYPGVVVVDRATHPYWIDKYKMSQLFNRDPELRTFKPKWNLYSKSYHSGLAQEIINDLGSEMFVIKPRGAFLGNGVIIVSAADLDKKLRYIFSQSEELKQDSDASYSYWYRDPFETFLVEEFVPSDPITVDQKQYHPTMRAAFILSYNQGEISVDILWCYWLLPFLEIGKKGTLNEQYKAYCLAPYFSVVDQTLQNQVEDELQIALPLLYKQMLNP